MQEQLDNCTRKKNVSENMGKRLENVCGFVGSYAQYSKKLYKKVNVRVLHTGDVNGNVESEFEKAETPGHDDQYLESYDEDEHEMK